jgi:hypothetical protein
LSIIAPRSGMFMVSKGIFIPVRGGDLAKFVGYPAADFGVLDYLVLNHLAIVGRGDQVRLDLCLNARDFEPKNLQVVVAHLKANPDYVQVRLRWFLGAWLTESFSRVDDAIARLRMIGDRELAVPDTRLRLAEQDPASPCPDTGGLFELWRRHSGRFSLDFVADAKGQGVLDRIFAFEPDDAGGWVIRFMGDGIGIFGDQQKDLVGRTFAASSTDRDYAEWVGRHHQSVLETGEGRYDHLDAIISTTATVPSRLRYRRRLLPFASLRGKPLVVGYSALSSDLALPL